MKKIELYIHIPFCVRKCNYCDFLSGPCDQKTRRRYVNALISEIYNAKKKLIGYEVVSIFFGGGTPSLLSQDEIKDLMGAVRDIANLSSDCEITVECNPGTVDEELLRTYIACGINRLSFGLQSTNNEELKLLGRIHTYEQFLHSYELARKAGFDNINVDLMSALPKQTLSQYEDTLQKVLELQPEHISAYSLIIEEGTKFDQLYGEHGTLADELPSVELDRMMYERTKELFHQHGYERYEISNYAKTGFECRHNIGYWQRVEYLGFGLGASSYYQKTRYHNEEDMETYIACIDNDENVTRDEEILHRKDEMEEFMFLGLRMCQGISKEAFHDYFHKNIDEIYGDVIKRLVEEKVLMVQDGYIYLTDYGLDVSNAVFAEFLL